MWIIFYKMSSSGGPTFLLIDLLKLFCPLQSKLSNLLFQKSTHWYRIISLYCMSAHPCPLHLSQMYLTLFINPVLPSLLWILILSESTQPSLKKRTAALTHYRSFRTVNFKKQKTTKKHFHFPGIVHTCQSTLGSVDVSTRSDFAFCLSASRTGTKCFLKAKAGTQP